jgi:hypothetical protein
MRLISDIRTWSLSNVQQPVNISAEVTATSDSWYEAGKQDSLVSTDLCHLIKEKGKENDQEAVGS